MARQGEPGVADESTTIHLKKHISIATWLDVLGVPEYTKAFQKFSGVQDIIQMSEADIRDLGVKNFAHRARMISSLVKLREKINRRLKPPISGVTSPYCSPPGSRDSTPPSLVDHPDYSCAHTYETMQSVAGGCASSAALVEVVEALSAHAWYHGGISRQHAERLLAADGDYLLRMSTSRPGDFVLTCRWNAGPLHFMVNRAAGGEYRFEEKAFGSVPKLLAYYVSRGKPVSVASGAVISCAVGRTALRGDEGCATRSAGSSPCRTPPVPVHRSGSHPQLTAVSRVDTARFGSCPSVAHAVRDEVRSPQRHVRAGSEPVLYLPAATAAMPKTNSFTAVTATPPPPSRVADGRPAPAKPSRVPTIKYRGDMQRPVVKVWNRELYEKEGEEYSDISEIVPGTGRQTVAVHACTGGPADGDVYDVPASLTPAKDAATPDTPSDFYDVPESSQSVERVSADVSADDSFYDVPEASRVDSSRLDASSSSRETVGGDGPVEPDELYDVPESSKLDSNSFRIPTSARDEVSADAPPDDDADADSLYDVPESAKLDASEFRIPKSARDDVLCDAHQDPTRDDRPERLAAVDIVLPDRDAPSQFDLPDYSSELLTPANKPLEGSAVATIRALLLGGEARDLALHLTHLDVTLLRMTGGRDLGVGVRSGIELVTLPHGQRMRDDLSERFQCMQLFVATTILTCTKFVERSKMMQKWIQVAQELHSVLGNMFGFAQVMAGLILPQISQLRATWQLVRQDASSLYTRHHTVLKPTLTAHHTLSAPPRGDAVAAPHGVCIPHLTPLLALLSWAPGRVSMSWDAGLDELLAQLTEGRELARRAPLYAAAAGEVLGAFRPTSTTLDMLSTPTQQRLLWGARGVTVPAPTRHAKFKLILSALALRAEPNSGGAESEL